MSTRYSCTHFQFDKVLEFQVVKCLPEQAHNSNYMQRKSSPFVARVFGSNIKKPKSPIPLNTNKTENDTPQAR